MSWWDDLTDWFGDVWDDIQDYYDPYHTNRDYKEKWTSPKTWDDPEEFDKLYDDLYGSTILRPLLDWHKNAKIKEDAKRWYDDYEKNTGQDSANSQYKWKDYYEKGLGKYSGYGSSGEFFEASSQVINQFSRKLKKW